MCLQKFFRACVCVQNNFSPIVRTFCHMCLQFRVRAKVCSRVLAKVLPGLRACVQIISREFERLSYFRCLQSLYHTLVCVRRRKSSSVSACMRMRVCEIFTMRARKCFVVFECVLNTSRACDSFVGRACKRFSCPHAHHHPYLHPHAHLTFISTPMLILIPIMYACSCLYVCAFVCICVCICVISVCACECIFVSELGILNIFLNIIT